ncbi:MAG: hypothetical protein HY055_06805 [Magnetospirillum sp.]|nr:hypothetical protein [Magnetospirillum sp.]
MASSLESTCLQGLELALKWASRQSDQEIALCTATIATGCQHRGDCPLRDECDIRLHELKDWLQASLPPL